MGKTADFIGVRVAPAAVSFRFNSAGRHSCLLHSSVHDGMIDDDGELSIFDNFDCGLARIDRVA